MHDELSIDDLDEVSGGFTFPPGTVFFPGDRDPGLVIPPSSPVVPQGTGAPDVFY
jgi:hypothetical protein